MPDDAALSEGASPRPPDGRWTEPFRALRHRPFRHFWLAQAISLTGSWMQGVAQRWLVHQITRPHSEAMLGITNALTALPVLFLAPVAGALADRFERRRILLGVQLVATAIALTLWLLTLTGWVRLWHILALALMMGCVRAFDVPTRQSFWVELVGRADLMSAITLNSAVVNLSRILGPSLGGVVIETVGITNCFLFNALSFLPPILVLWKMPSLGSVNAQTANLLVSLREGIGHLRDNLVVLRLLLLVHELLVQAVPQVCRLIGTGGALVRSRLWAQMFADVLGQPVTLCLEPEASARGAAIMALKAMGIWRTLTEHPPRTGETLQPDEANHRYYQDALRRQRQIYELVRWSIKEATKPPTVAHLRAYP